MKHAATMFAPIWRSRLRGRHRCAAGGDEIVDQEDALLLADRVGVDLHFVDAVFERVGDANGFVRELALLADRHEAGGQLMCHGAAEDEAPRLDARDLVDAAARIRIDQLVDRPAERPRVAEQRRDVPEHDAGFRVVRDRADRGLEIGDEMRVHGDRLDEMSRP